MSMKKMTVTSCSFIAFLQRAARWKQRIGSIATSRSYTTALKSFSRFVYATANAEVAITAQLIELYDVWLAGNGVCKNSRSCYMRSLRSCWNRLCDTEKIAVASPFVGVYTGVAKTSKRAITEYDMHKIKRVDLSAMPKLAFARDMFMLSFYLRGIAPVDLFMLRKDNIAAAHILYHRKKTGQPMKILINEKIKSLLVRYPAASSSPYLLPILSDGSWQEYQSKLRLFNYRLKKVADLAGVNVRLTTYTARHTWASIACAKGVPMGCISKGLGHDNETTTQIYISSIDTGIVDRANEIVTEGL